MNRNIDPDPPAPGKVARWSLQDSRHPANAVLQADQSFQGPTRVRTCRDFLYCLVFLLFNAGLLTLCVVSNV